MSVPYATVTALDLEMAEARKSAKKDGKTKEKSQEKEDQPKTKRKFYVTKLIMHAVKF